MSSSTSSATRPTPSRPAGVDGLSRSARAFALPQPSRPFDSPLRHSNRPFTRSDELTGDVPEENTRVGFLLLEHFSLMAFTGALDAIVTANLVNGTPLFAFQTFGLETEPVRSDLGIQVSVDATLPDARLHALDLLIVCGGYRSNLQAQRTELDILRKAARAQIALGSLWNGVHLLAAAGLLDGYACTVHPESRPGLEEAYPNVHVQPLPFVIDRDRLSCAGANSALGMMLAFIQQRHGDEITSGIADILACDRSMDDVKGHSMPSLARSPTLPAPLRLVLELMENNIEEPLTMEDLARLAEISLRQLDRLFQRHIGTSPARYYLELRITRARRLLLQTCDPITSIAIACGFTGAPHFSRCYREFFGETPSDARRKST
ncbi:GlxA family transcriptional regulator [Nitrogeniibacter aestuarii]|uniref:GlxA family transcriptional regulator n=1 Tax=Nitrogeniibacter aestuarii TaxID=2815343 RepID=UPI001D12BFB7|nr:GlxA family transcriptional regulator [Nitrogeniibacter aestuarii]